MLNRNCYKSLLVAFFFFFYTYGRKVTLRKLTHRSKWTYVNSRPVMVEKM